MLKATGIVRRVDELGRVVLPIELRKVLNINEKDGLEIFVEDDRIILRKYDRCCTLTDKVDELAGMVKNVYDPRECRGLLEKISEVKVLIEQDLTIRKR